MEEKEIKKQIRQQMLSEREKISLEIKKYLDDQICQKIMQTIIHIDAKIIHSFLPLGSEINVKPLLQQLIQQNYQIVCPKSLPKRTIQNLVLNSLTELDDGRFGTKHPAGNNVYTGTIDLYIVPGIAFDKNGYRIGYGSGYYDTYFSQQSIGYKLGICYPFQIINNFPIESHDVKLDEIIF